LADNRLDPAQMSFARFLARLAAKDAGAAAPLSEILAHTQKTDQHRLFYGGATKERTPTQHRLFHGSATQERTPTQHRLFHRSAPHHHHPLPTTHYPLPPQHRLFYGSATQECTPKR